MSLSKKIIGASASAAMVAVGLTVAVAAPSSSQTPLECDADAVSLVIENGQKQYFECDDSDGTLRQGLTSKNPWVVEAEPALMQTPAAEPDGAVGQVFTGSTQGAGVISSADTTGSERDSISRSETLTFEQAQLAETFGSLDLAVNVLPETPESDVTIRVEALTGEDEEVTLEGGEHVVPFFQETIDDQVSTRGFTLSVVGNGAFQLLSGTQFIFFDYFTECDLGEGNNEVLFCELVFNDITLRVNYVDGNDFPVRVDIDPTEPACGSVTPLVEDTDFQRFEVFCERPIDYDQELEGEVANDSTGQSFIELDDCAATPIDPDGTTKQSCIKSLSWDTDDGLRDFTADSYADGDPFYR